MTEAVFSDGHQGAAQVNRHAPLGGGGTLAQFVSLEWKLFYVVTHTHYIYMSLSYNYAEGQFAALLFKSIIGGLLLLKSKLTRNLKRNRNPKTFPFVSPPL